MFLQVKVGIPTKDFLARFPSTTVQFVAIGIKGVNLSKANTWYWKIHHVLSIPLGLSPPPLGKKFGERNFV